MSEASRALAAIVVEHRASGHQGGAGCPAGPAAFRVHRPPGFERSRSGGERCPVRREMISDGLHRRTSHPLREHPQPDQPGGRPGRAHRQGRAAHHRVRRRMGPTSSSESSPSPRHARRRPETPGGAPRRLCSTKSARETSWTAETCSCSPKRQPPCPLSHSCSARSGGQRRASRHAPEREARSLDRKRRPGPPGDGRLHRERQRRPHLGPRHLAEHFPGGVDWMLFDARQHPQAQRVYHTGIRLAREAGTSLTTRHSTTNLVTSAAYRPRGWATTTTLPRSWTSPRGRRSCRPLWPP